MTAFKAEMFQDEDKAREALEALRWPDGPYCPHCGNSDQEKIAKVEGKKHSHVGIYLGDGRFIHAPSTGKSVRNDRVDSPYWKKHLSDARRVTA